MVFDNQISSKVLGLHSVGSLKTLFLMEDEDELWIFNPFVDYFENFLTH
jgi:hypothetical protein